MMKEKLNVSASNIVNVCIDNIDGVEGPEDFTVITVKILYSSEVFMNSSAIWSDS